MNIGLAVALFGLTSLALAILLVPLLLRGRRAGSREEYNLAVYRDQLAEIERDVGRGLLDTAQAETARAEIARRILALRPSVAVSEPSDSAGPQPLVAAMVAVLLLPLAAWAIYWQLGSPSLPDQPFAARAGAGNTAVAQGGAPHIDMNEAVARLDAHLKQQPEDLAGWLLLGRSELSLGHHQKAADAYRQAAELSGQRADIAGDWGEAQVLAAGGTVTAAARAAFEAGLKDPENAPRSRYYLALAQLQQGNAKAALDAWVALEKASPADAEWLPLLRQRIAQAAKALGIDPPGVESARGTAASPSGGPSAATVADAAKAVASASPDQRQAMIRAMVEKLATRLEEQPDDADGWSRLGRSYLVLHQPGKAREAYARAVKLQPSDIRLKEAYAEAIIAASPADAAAPPAEATAVMREILRAEPDNQMALWYVGLAEADSGHREAARNLWSRLLAALPQDAPERREIAERLAALAKDKPQ